MTCRKTTCKRRRRLSAVVVAAVVAAGSCHGIETPLTVDVPAGRTNVVAEAIVGEGAVVKTGLGALVLSGENTFTGGLRIEGGLVRADSAGALGRGVVTISQGDESRGHLMLNAEGAVFAPERIVIEGPQTASADRWDYGTAVQCLTSCTVDCDVTSAGSFRFGTYPVAGRGYPDRNPQVVTWNGNVSGTGVSIRGFGTQTLNGRLTASSWTMGTDSGSTGTIYLNNPSNRFTWGINDTYNPRVVCGNTNVLGGGVLRLIAGQAVNVYDLNGFDQTLTHIDTKTPGAPWTNATANVSLTSSRPATLTLVGAPSGTDSATGMFKLSGEASLVCDFARPSFRQAFRDRTHDSRGSVEVRRGILELTGTTCFDELRALTVGAAGELTVATTGGLWTFGSLTNLTVEGRLDASAAAAAPFYPFSSPALVLSGAGTVAFGEGRTVYVKSLTVDGRTLTDKVDYTSADLPGRILSGTVHVGPYGRQRTNPGAASDAWAHYPEKWVYWNGDLKTEDDLAKMENLARRAASAGCTALSLSGGTALNRRPETWNRYRRLRCLCEELGLDLVAAFGAPSGDTVLHELPNLSEAQPVTVTYRADGDKARLVPAAAPGLPNGGFEETDAAGRMVAWGADNDGDKVVVGRRRSSLDGSVVHGGNRSLRFDLMKSAEDKPARASILFPVETNRSYRLSAWIRRGRGIDRLMRLELYCSGGSHYYQTRRLVTAGNEDEWERVYLDFNSEDETSFRFWIMFTASEDGAQAWIDDVSIADRGLKQVVRREGCDVTVRDAVSGRIYEEGIDYGAVPGLKSVAAPKDDAPDVELDLLPGGAIADGAILEVTANVPVPLQKQGTQANGMNTSCLSAPERFREYALAADEIVRILRPQRWFLHMDEVRYGGNCSHCRSCGKDMAHLLAEYANRQRAIIRARSPDAEIYVWGDMYAPDQNAVARYMGCRGSLEGGADLLEKDIAIVDWGAFENRQREATKMLSLEYFREKGFRVLGAGFYDVADAEADAVAWTQGLNAIPGALGYMYTTWTTPPNYDCLDVCLDAVAANERPSFLTCTWTGGACGEWTDPANWDRPPEPRAIVSIPAGAVVHADRTAQATLDQLKELKLDGRLVLEAESAPACTVSGSGILDRPRRVTAESPLTVDVPAGETNAILAAISGDGSVVKRGLGALVLGGANTFTGGLRVEGGLVRADSAGALGRGVVMIRQGDVARGHVMLNAEGATFAPKRFVVEGAPTSRSDIWDYGCALQCLAGCTVDCDVMSVSNSFRFGTYPVAGRGYPDRNPQVVIWNGDVYIEAENSTTISIRGFGTQTLNGRLKADYWELGTDSGSTGRIFLNDPQNCGRLGVIASYQPYVTCGNTNVLGGGMLRLINGATLNVYDLKGFDQTLTHFETKTPGPPWTNSTANVSLTSERPATVTLTGRGWGAGETGMFKLSGRVSLVCDFTRTAFCQRLLDRTHDTSGTVEVRRGALELAGTTRFTDLRSLAVGADGELKVTTTGDACVFDRLESLVVEGRLDARGAHGDLFGSEAQTALAIQGNGAVDAGAGRIVCVRTLTVGGRRLKRGVDYTAADLPGRILSGTIRVRPRDPSEGFSVLLR